VGKPEIVYPEFSKDRGVAYWSSPRNLWASRRKIFRRDHSNLWRYSFDQTRPAVDPSRSVSFSRLLGRSAEDGFRFLILADSGEGDRSQYGLLPLIHFLAPDFLILNGDLAYPAGRIEDFEEGFFKPYRNLKIPVWAVPGNHEYYSRNQGREFYEIFCTRQWSGLWAEYGLTLQPQPGTYWELKEPLNGPSGRTPSVVILGVDTGKAADLDGRGDQPEDVAQHEWLRWRLRVAELEKRQAIMIFHIPALVREQHIAKTHLSILHQIIGASPCVRLVICGHEHNFQAYAPDTFGKYLNEVHTALPAEGRSPHYLVSGGGGAFLGATDFKTGNYPMAGVFPDREAWRNYANLMRKVVTKSGLAKTWIGHLAGVFNEALMTDADVAQLLSFLLVTLRRNADGWAVEVTPVFMNDVELLFAHLPNGTRVRIDDPHAPVDPKAVQHCLQPTLTL